MLWRLKSMRCRCAWSLMAIAERAIASDPCRYPCAGFLGGGNLVTSFVPSGRDRRLAPVTVTRITPTSCSCSWGVIVWAWGLRAVFRVPAIWLCILSVLRPPVSVSSLSLVSRPLQRVVLVAPSPIDGGAKIGTS